MKISLLLNLFIAFLVLVFQPALAEESLPLAQKSSAVYQLDINAADAEELSVMLSGIGESKAEAIIAYREQHGDFQTVDELALVSGVGEKTLELNRHMMVVEVSEQ